MVEKGQKSLSYLISLARYHEISGLFLLSLRFTGLEVVYHACRSGTVPSFEALIVGHLPPQIKATWDHQVSQFVTYDGSRPLHISHFLSSSYLHILLVLRILS